MCGKRFAMACNLKTHAKTHKQQNDFLTYAKESAIMAQMPTYPYQIKTEDMQTVFKNYLDCYFKDMLIPIQPKFVIHL